MRTFFKIHSKEILLPLILLVIFRILFFIAGNTFMMRMPVLLLFSFVIIFFVVNFKNLRSSILTNKGYTLLLFATFISPLSILLFNTSPNMDYLQIAKSFLSTIGTYGLISLFCLMTFKRNQMTEFIDTICLIVLFIGGGLWIFESIGETLGFFNRTFFKKLYTGTNLTQVVSRYGFQGDAANSIAMLTAAGHWCYARCFETSNTKKSYLLYAGVTISAASVSLGESILSYLVFLAVIICITLFYAKKQTRILLSSLILYTSISLFIPNRTYNDLYFLYFLSLSTFFFLKRRWSLVHFKFIGVSLLNIILLTFGFHSNVEYRINRYLNEDSYLLKLFLPNLSGCSLQVLTQNSFHSKCSFAEFHIFRVWEESNIFIFLVMSLYFIYIIIQFFNIGQLKKTLTLSSLVLPFSLILLSIHYRPIATWGPNLLFTLGLSSLMTREANE